MGVCVWCVCVSAERKCKRGSCRESYSVIVITKYGEPLEYLVSISSTNSSANNLSFSSAFSAVRNNVAPRYPFSKQSTMYRVRRSSFFLTVHHLLCGKTRVPEYQSTKVHVPSPPNRLQTKVGTITMRSAMISTLSCPILSCLVLSCPAPLNLDSTCFQSTSMSN